MDNKVNVEIVVKYCDMLCYSCVSLNQLSSHIKKPVDVTVSTHHSPWRFLRCHLKHSTTHTPENMKNNVTKILSQMIPSISAFRYPKLAPILDYHTKHPLHSS